MNIIIITCILVCLNLYVLYWYISYREHITMTKKYRKIEVISYLDFKKIFDEINWILKDGYLDYNLQNYIIDPTFLVINSKHYSIINFKDYIKIIFMIKKKIFKLSK